MHGRNFITQLVTKNLTLIFIVLLASSSLLAYIGLQSVSRETEIRRKAEERILSNALTLTVHQVESRILREIRFFLSPTSEIHSPAERWRYDTLFEWIAENRYTRVLTERDNHLLIRSSFQTSYFPQTHRSDDLNSFIVGGSHDEERYSDSIEEWNDFKSKRAPVTAVPEEPAFASIIDRSLPSSASFTAASLREIGMTAITDTRGDWVLCYALSPNECSSSVKLVGCLFRKENFVAFVQDHLAAIEPETGGHVVLNHSPNGSSLQTGVVRAAFDRLHPVLYEFNVSLDLTSANPLKSIPSANLTVYYAMIMLILALAFVASIGSIRELQRERESINMKSEFIANVSHEIRTPIAAICALTENLREGWIQDRQKQAEYFNLLAQESERASLLVTNVLDFSRMEAGMNDYQFMSVDVGNVILRALERFRFLYDRAGIQLNVDVEPNAPFLQADASALEHAVLNLLDNAIKYSRDEKRISLSVYSRDHNVCISVSDCGVGIPAGERKNIFRKFYRVGTGNPVKARGNGIGLSIVKEIIDAHQGYITVNSAVGKGSTFTIHLPVQPAF